MSHNDPLSIIRQSIIDQSDLQSSPGLKAVEITRALERAGLNIVGADVVAAFACIAQHAGVDPW